jgi:hypothetical protein
MGIAIALLFYAAWIAFMFWVGHRVGKPKNRNWFLWCFFLGWIGVLVMWLGADKSVKPEAKPEAKPALYDPHTGERLALYDPHTGERLAVEA